MNLSVIALAVLAWKILSDNKQQSKPSPSQPKINLTDLLNDDVKTVLQGAETLTSKGANAEEKMGAIIGLMSNPTVMSFAENLFGQKEAKPAEEAPPQQQPFVNDEGYQFETPSGESVEFFRPIDNIADAEVKNKLYWFYDHWYL